MKIFPTKLLSASLLLCGLVMIGCTKQEEPTTQKKEETKTESTQDTQAVLACDDVAIKNSLIRALSTATNDEVLTLMDSYANADKLDLARRTQQHLGQISLELQNIHADGDSCLADVVAVLPSGDLSHATSYYKSAGKPSLTELGQTYSTQISDGRLVIPVRYSVQNGITTLTDTPSALGFIANIVSASAYHSAQSERQIANATAAVTRPIQPQAPARTEVARPKPVQREPELDTTPTQETTNNTNSQELETPPTAKPTIPKTEAKPEATKSAPIEGDGELVIVESDETY